MPVSAKKSPRQSHICCRKRDPFQGPKLGSYLTLGNELSEETQVLTKQEISLGKGPRVESSRVREPRRNRKTGKRKRKQERKGKGGKTCKLVSSRWLLRDPESQP